MKNAKEFLLSVMAWFFGLWAFISGSIILLIVGLFGTGTLFERTLKRMCRLVVFCVGIRLKVRGIQNIDPDNQYILMMNHVNLLDPFLFYPYFPGRARGIEEESHFKWPLYGRVIRRIGQFPISRKSGIKALETLKEAAKLIKSRSDSSVVVLPEGTRTLTGQLGRFKKGGFLLALETGLDILPMIQTGGFNIKRKNNWKIRPGKMELIFESPISIREYSKEKIADLMEKTRATFLKYVD
jgi:1-acyl-sn-glycerol-3-phosphate acyltransferase